MKKSKEPVSGPRTMHYKINNVLISLDSSLGMHKMFSIFRTIIRTHRQFAFLRFKRRLVPTSSTMVLRDGTLDGTFCFVPKFRNFTMALEMSSTLVFCELRKGE